MKKGDILERRKEVPKGTVLMRAVPTHELDAFMEKVQGMYNFPELIRLGSCDDDANPGKLCIVNEFDTHIVMQAKVNWRVDHEVAIEYLDTGAGFIMDMTLEENKGWVVIHEATPEYQDSVEHLTDDQLRASIDQLRQNRLSRPTLIKRKTTRAEKEPAMSAEDKVMLNVLKDKSPEEILELKRKLGLIDD